MSFLLLQEMKKSRVIRMVCLKDSMGGEEGASPLTLNKSVWIGGVQRESVLVVLPVPGLWAPC